MNKEKIINFIKSNMEPDDFTGGVDEKQVNYVQIILEVNLPASYKCFLNNNGSGGLYGGDILGVAKFNIATVVLETKNYRDLSMGEHLVVIEDIDEYAYCLDTSKMENNECPIIAWNKQGGLKVNVLRRKVYFARLLSLFNLLL